MRMKKSQQHIGRKDYEERKHESRRSYSLICLSSVIKGIGFGCDGATMFGCLQDAITYGEWYNGYGTAGMGNAASSFCMKVGSGVGTAALG